MGEPTRAEYHAELRAIEERALEGLDLAVHAIDRALEAVRSQDAGLAREVVEGDDELDARYLEAHERLLTLIAREAPVAGDLRLISALLHVIKSMERMGDQCVNVAKMIPIAGSEPPADERLLQNVGAMGLQVRSQMDQAKRAFAGRDLDLARDLVRQDDIVDALNRECFRIAIEIGDEPDRREWATAMILVARALERIGDNAVDVGEQAAYVVTGQFREFDDASHPGAPGAAG